MADMGTSGAFMKIGMIEGESQDKAHDKWVEIQSMTSAISRSVGAIRAQGQTTLGDVCVVRYLDKSSPKLSEACANGTLYDEVQIDFTSQIKDKNEPYLTYKLKNVIVTGYTLRCVGDITEKATEEVMLNFTDVEWTYMVWDKKTFKKVGPVAGKYVPMKGATA